MAILEQASVLTDAIRPVPAKELEQRLEKFRKHMDARHPEWEMAVISHKVAMYYFTGDDAGGSAHHHSGGCDPVGAAKFHARFE